MKELLKKTLMEYVQQIIQFEKFIYKSIIKYFLKEYFLNIYLKLSLENNF